MQRATWATLVVLLLVFEVASQGFQEWAGALSAATMHSSFIVWGETGQQMKVHVTADDTREYEAKLYRPGEYYPTSSAYQTVLLQGASSWESGVLEVGGFWRLEVLPVQPD